MHKFITFTIDKERPLHYYLSPEKNGAALR